MRFTLATLMVAAALGSAQAAGFDCSKFEQQADGSWKVVQALEIRGRAAASISRRTKSTSRARKRWASTSPSSSTPIAPRNSRRRQGLSAVHSTGVSSTSPRSGLKRSRRVGRQTTGGGGAVK